MLDLNVLDDIDDVVHGCKGLRSRVWCSWGKWRCNESSICWTGPTGVVGKRKKRVVVCEIRAYI